MTIKVNLIIELFQGILVVSFNVNFYGAMQLADDQKFLNNTSLKNSLKYA